MRGKRGEASTISRRSGSAAARFISVAVPPACSERLHQPRRRAGAAAVAITRGACSSSSGAKRRKSAGAKLMFGAGVAQRPLDRAEEAGEVVDVGVVEELGADQQQRAVDAQVLPVVALAERLQQRGGLAGAQRDAEGVGRLATAPPPPRSLSVSAIGPDPIRCWRSSASRHAAGAAAPRPISASSRLSPCGTENSPASTTTRSEPRVSKPPGFEVTRAPSASSCSPSWASSGASAASSARRCSRCRRTGRASRASSAGT